MSSKAMSLKGHINNYAKQHHIAAQVVLQNYMFERFLIRLSCSDYHQKFIVKGGMLVAALVGLDTRSTMDLDTTLRNMPLSEEMILQAIRAVCDTPAEDDVVFNIVSIEPIRKDDVYGGYRVRLDACYDTIITPLSIDVSTGDVITPRPVAYEFRGIFDETLRIPLWGYNIETILAEKVETILRRSTFNTRPRDFYDVYILESMQPYDKAVFAEALHATAEHRGSTEIFDHINETLNRIENSNDLQAAWARYQQQFSYAKQILYAALINTLRGITNGI